MLSLYLDKSSPSALGAIAGGSFQQRVLFNQGWASSFASRTLATLQLQGDGVPHTFHLQLDLEYFPDTLLATVR